MPDLKCGEYVPVVTKPTGFCLVSYMINPPFGIIAFDINPNSSLCFGKFTNLSFPMKNFFFRSIKLPNPTSYGLSYILKSLPQSKIPASILLIFIACILEIFKS